MKEYKDLKNIKNIIFDLKGSFVTIDNEATKRKLEKFGFTDFDDEMIKLNKQFDLGKVSINKFLAFYKSKFPKAEKEELKEAWNAIILDFPQERIDFLEKISKKYKTFLLSNINDLHIEKIRTLIDEEIYIDFLFYFEMIFYSHIIDMQKPNKEPIEFILKRNNLKAEETLFIDDSIENCKVAKNLGFKVWYLEPKFEDIIELEKYL